MIIAISGTPGTGKTAAAKILSRKLKANLITAKSLINRKQLGYVYDRKRKTKIIDEKDFEKAVIKAVARNKVSIVESHLSHLIKADFVFVLRTNPRVLERRMKKRKWTRSKIKENLEAEIIDEITVEAMKKNKRVFEIDTSKRSAKQTVYVIIKILNNLSYGKKYRPGKTDWAKHAGVLKGY